jgi:hypothetical protein
MTGFEYFCEKCDVVFEIYRSMKQGRWTLAELKDEKEDGGQCPHCKNISFTRKFSAKIQFVGASVEDAEYNPALGQVVKNSRHRKEIAKQKGLIEVGNEKTESLHKQADKQRADKLKKTWENV